MAKFFVGFIIFAYSPIRNPDMQEVMLTIGWADLKSFLSVGYILFVIVTIAVIIHDKREPVKALSWIIVISLLPVVGFVFYIVFGRNHRKQKLFNRKELHDLEQIDALSRQQIYEINHPSLLHKSEISDHRDTITLLLNSNKALLTVHNRVRVLNDGAETFDEIRRALRREAQGIMDEDIEISRSIGRCGLELLRPGMGILTHCNAGTLATAKYGTALAPVYAALEAGLEGLRVYCDETRPLLQGARLSAFEMVSAGVDTTLLCDNMASSLMKSGKVDIIFVGCDRVARNGDAANKIGTSGVAILAAHYGIPFYVCAPSSTIDPAIASGAEIPIEFRDGSEVTELWYAKRMAPEGVGVYNPAFDVTEAGLITGIITERGMVRAPFEAGFRELGLLG